MPRNFRNAQTLDVIRERSNGDYTTGGVYQRGTEERFTVSGSIQPMSQSDLQQLPEGERTSSHRKVYCMDWNRELVMADESNGHQGDQVLFDGWRWEVRAIQYYDAATGGSLAHRRYRITRIAPDEYEDQD